jgi:hypothetical protein
MILLPDAEALGKGLNLFLLSGASSDNVYNSDAPESRHVIHVVNETTTDHAY